MTLVAILVVEATTVNKTMADDEKCVGARDGALAKEKFDSGSTRATKKHNRHS